MPARHEANAEHNRWMRVAQYRYETGRGQYFAYCVDCPEVTQKYWPRAAALNSQDSMRSPSDPSLPREADGMVGKALTPGDNATGANVSHQILFTLNSIVLSPDALKVIDEVAQAASTASQIDIHGYTCDLGSSEYNNALARRRAEAVKAALIAKKVATPINITAKGKCCYVTPNTDESSRARNRRVEIQLQLKPVKQPDPNSVKNEKRPYVPSLRAALEEINAEKHRVMRRHPDDASQTGGPQNHKAQPGSASRTSTSIKISEQSEGV